MTIQEQISSFALDYHRPFSGDTAAQILGLDPVEVDVAIDELVAAGMLKRLSTEQRIFAHVGRWNIAHHSAKCVGLYATTAKQICDLLEAHEVRSARQLAMYCGKSRQFAYCYLEALVSVQAVEWLPPWFRVVREKRRANELESTILQTLRDKPFHTTIEIKRSIRCSFERLALALQKLTRGGYIEFQPGRYVVRDRSRLVLIGDEVRKGCLHHTRSAWRKRAA